MFVKVTHSGPRSYVQLVEAYRDEAGRPKQRTVATLGRLDQLGTELDSVVSGLLRVTGRAAQAATPAPTVTFMRFAWFYQCHQWHGATKPGVTPVRNL